MSRLLLSTAAHRHGCPPEALPISTAAAATFTGGFLPWWSKSGVAVTLRCNALSRSQSDVTQSVLKCGTTFENGVQVEEEKASEEHLVADKIESLIDAVTRILNSVGDGNISPSPYDTAWVALLSDSGRPRFPVCLEWIWMNQLEDGSWGDPDAFSIYDRVLNTLACVIALKTWDMHHHKCQKGVAFIEKNIEKMEEEEEDQMPIGFEITFPSLIPIAEKLHLNINISNDSHALRRVYLKRHLKLSRIPMDVVHRVPTTLLHSLEGLPGLDWESLGKLQSADGSFLFSPASTAFAHSHTGDSRSHRYLADIVQKFRGGVPNVYPVDLFERIWAVDRLSRLGISRYFKSQIEDCIDYVHRYWVAEKGICWARESEVQDIDDTAMGFRLLRLHGRHVSADAFSQFEKAGEFVCFAGQSTQAVTGMYNLYRASQLTYGGEGILERASHFAAEFLRRKRTRGELVDKWIITKDLPGEVGYALDVPWYGSLPRLEARFYLEQYGGQDDVWIGKTLYRMPNVNNDTYLELAKLDYNNCQALHQREWKTIRSWYKNLKMGDESLSERSLLLAYFTSAASVFEPEKSETRLAWAKTSILLDNLRGISQRDKVQNGSSSLVEKAMRTVNELSLNVLLARGRDIYPELHRAWLKWFGAWQKGENTTKSDVELILQTINLTGERRDSISPEHRPDLLEATANVCHQIRHLKDTTVNGGYDGATTPEVEAGMRKLVQMVLSSSSRDEEEEYFLMVAKGFYYGGYFSHGTIDSHIHKVLFQSVL